MLLPSGHSLFHNCHASTLVDLPDGALLCGFFAGEREGAGNTAIWLSSHREGQWHTPRRAFAEAGLAHWNPVLHAEGNRVWLFYKVGATVHEWTTRVAVSEDGGQSWGAARALIAGEASPRGPVKNKMLVLSSGEWLAPASVETETAWDAFVDCSADHGATWRSALVPIDHTATCGAQSSIWSGLAENALWETNLQRVFAWDGVIQPSLWESAAGHVHMLLRSTRGWVYRSDSVDNGKTWCAAYATSLPNNNSGLDLVRLDDGALVLAYNPIAANWGSRTPLSLAGSSDNGETWSHLADLETAEGEFSYPAIIAVENRLHVTYTWNRKNIIHQQFRVV